MVHTDMTITFPGGAKVDATLNDTVVRTDQSIKSGGEGTAPEPYMHFLASIGTCAGIYVLRFCQSRQIPTEGLKITQHLGFDEKTGKLKKVGLEIHLPPEFPEKYKSAVIRSADQCAVKKTILDPPEFDVFTTEA